MCAMVRKERALGWELRNWGTPPGRSPRPTGPQAGRTAHCEGRAPAALHGVGVCGVRCTLVGAGWELGNWTPETQAPQSSQSSRKTRHWGGVKLGWERAIAATQARPRCDTVAGRGLSLAVTLRHLVGCRPRPLVLRLP